MAPSISHEGLNRAGFTGSLSDLTVNLVRARDENGEFAP